MHEDLTMSQPFQIIDHCFDLVYRIIGHCSRLHKHDHDHQILGRSALISDLMLIMIISVILIRPLLLLVPP